MTKRGLIVGILGFIGVCLSGVAGAENAKVTVALARNTVTAAEETFTYAIPKQLGYFAVEKLDVGILQTNGSTAALQAIVSGSADIAYASSASIAAAIDKGAPIRAFAGITVQWPYFIGVPEGSTIKTVADLKGKRIGVVSMASASYADLRANLKIAGLKEEDVTIVPVGAGARAAAALKAEQIDAIDSYSDSFTVMAQNGIKLMLMERPEAITKLFSVTMVASTKTLKEQPEKIAAFARAAYRGVIYTSLYPDSALTLAFKEFPELPGSADPASQDAKNTAEAMQVALGDSIPAGKTDPRSWGRWLDIPADRWEALLAFAYETQQTDKKLTPAEVWDGSLMARIYDFDPKAITEKK